MNALEPNPAAAVGSHPALPQEQQPDRRSRGWRRFFTGRFLAISIVAHLLFGAAAAVWVVQRSHTQRKPNFISAPSSPNAATRAMEHRVQMAKQRKMLTAPPVSKRVTTTGLSKVALPDMPALPAMPAATALLPARMPGMMGGGSGAGASTMKGVSGFGNGSGHMFTASIGGLRLQAQRLAVALDVSGSVAQYQAEMNAHVAKTFKGSEVGEFMSAGFNARSGKSRSLGDVVLDFLNSPKKFDAIYIFSDFGETRDEQLQWPEVQKLATEKKVRLYLHVLRAPGKENKIKPALAEVIAFAKRTGGNVKIGPMNAVSEAGEG